MSDGLDPDDELTNLLASNDQGDAAIAETLERDLTALKAIETLTFKLAAGQELSNEEHTAAVQFAVEYEPVEAATNAAELAAVAAQSASIAARAPAAMSLWAASSRQLRVAAAKFDLAAAALELRGVLTDDQ
jgi:hypothetical protein